MNLPQARAVWRRYFFDGSGLRATTMNIGEKTPSLPPTTRESAPLHSVRCTFTEPAGAKPTSSMPISATCVNHRPMGVILKSDNVQRGCKTEYHATGDCFTMSAVISSSKPFDLAAWNTVSMLFTSGRPSPICRKKQSSSGQFERETSS